MENSAPLYKLKKGSTRIYTHKLIHSVALRSLVFEIKREKKEIDKQEKKIIGRRFLTTETHIPQRLCCCGNGCGYPSHTSSPLSTFFYCC